jgi:hypothetical protein
LRSSGELRLGNEVGEPAFRRNRRRGGRECDEVLAIGTNVAIVGAGDAIATKYWLAPALPLPRRSRRSQHHGADASRRVIEHRRGRTNEGRPVGHPSFVFPPLTREQWERRWCTGRQARRRFGRTDRAPAWSRQRSLAFRPQDRNRSQQRSPSPRSGNCDQPEVGRLYEFHPGAAALLWAASELVPGAGHEGNAGPVTDGHGGAGATEGSTGMARTLAGTTPAGASPAARFGSPPSGHYTLPTRPIVAAVHHAPPATYGTPGRAGSVSAERPSQGSGIPCAILAGRAS